VLPGKTALRAQIIAATTDPVEGLSHTSSTGSSTASAAHEVSLGLRQSPLSHGHKVSCHQAAPRDGLTWDACRLPDLFKVQAQLKLRPALESVACPGVGVALAARFDGRSSGSNQTSKASAVG